MNKDFFYKVFLANAVFPSCYNSDGHKVEGSLATMQVGLGEALQGQMVGMDEVELAMAVMGGQI